ncbi:extracellular solute-binding protein, family 1 [Rubrobacter xylanophilus DSM 9941]|uniref:Extracellular solute-binding protein, family 1 n=1 Tax=Rubrobacter xylanophilus (strain DSM 9941 / JCM 11954 / NBRC 16129 / PRD-1) TaxID=266117 RepID=Q1AZY5_RUBXD|nr:ABC transporter substrate-binding protein [Rubrobacter xylanophilus]ABG03043.1 extracellular solute-binding protein, family 1 [Rubrobacter xylanophilus DSM 9941]
MGERRISRRGFLGLGGGALAGAVLLGGCGGGGGGSGEVLFSWGPDDTGVLPRLIERFNRENGSGITVRYREMPSDTGQYFDQLRTQFQAGGGDIDVIGGDVIWPAQFAANGWIVDLSDRFEDAGRFLEGPMQAMTYEGKVYGVPWYTDAGLLYYRKDLLEKSGYSEPPRTWDELREMALRVKQDSGVPAGFVFQGAEYEGGVCDGLEYIWTHGGDVLDPEDPTKVLIDSPESVAGLKTERSMVEEGVAPEAVTTYKEDESHGAFLRGDAVFLRNWPYVYALVGDPEQSRIEPGQVGISELPVGGEGQQSYSCLGGWNFFINASSGRQEEAWEFIRWMTEPEQLKVNALQGSRLPTRRGLYEDREVLEKVPVARLGKEAIIQNSRPRPVSPYYSDMSLRMAEQFSASLKGEVSPEQAVKTLQGELQRLIEEGEAATG